MGVKKDQVVLIGNHFVWDKVILCVLTLLVSLGVQCLSVREPPETRKHHAEWMAWRNATRRRNEYSSMYYNRTLDSAEEDKRYRVWARNRAFINAHNKKGNWTFTTKLNDLADMDDKEYGVISRGLLDFTPTNIYSIPRWISVLNVSAAEGAVHLAEELLPTEVDWRNSSLVSAVKTQGACGSCYAFSAIGAVESQLVRMGLDPVFLSTQELVDCSYSFGNYGCLGGLMTHCYDYIQSSKGIATQSSYPYIEKKQDCSSIGLNRIKFDLSYNTLPPGNELALKKVVAQHGPVSVGIDSTLRTFQLYSGGLYYDPRCSRSAVSHAVIVVGYGGEPPNEYWIIKNSWGPSWGVMGYMYLSRNKDNHCGVATLASYPSIGIINGDKLHDSAVDSRCFSTPIFGVLISSAVIIYVTHRNILL